MFSISFFQLGVTKRASSFLVRLALNAKLRDKVFLMKENCRGILK